MKYRKLKKNEIIKEGDHYYRWFDWVLVDETMIGRKCGTYNYFFRRPIPTVELIQEAKKIIHDIYDKEVSMGEWVESYNDSIENGWAKADISYKNAVFKVITKLHIEVWELYVELEEMGIN